MTGAIRIDGVGMEGRVCRLWANGPRQTDAVDRIWGYAWFKLN
jgi:hypothetical protein